METTPQQTSRKRAAANPNVDLEADAAAAAGAEKRDAIVANVLGLVLAAVALLWTVALVSYETNGPNRVGEVGALVAGSTLFISGLGAFIVPIMMLVGGVAKLRNRAFVSGFGAAAGYLILIGALPAVFHMSFDSNVLGGPAGGVLGGLTGTLLTAALGTMGATVVLATSVVIAIVLITERTLIDMWQALVRLASGVRRPRRRAVDADDADIEVGDEDEWDVAFGDATGDDADTDDEDAADEGGDDAAPSAWARLRERFQGRAGRRRSGVAHAADADVATDDQGEGDDDGPGLREPAWAMALGDDDDVALDPPGPDTESEAPPVKPRRKAPKAPEIRAERGRGAETAPTDADATEVEVDAAPAPQPAPVRTPTRTQPEPAPAKAQPAAGRAELPSADPDVESLGPVIVESAAQKNRKRAEDLDGAQQVALPLDAGKRPWQLPPRSYLRYEEQTSTALDREKLHDLAERLERVLADFKVSGRVSGICPGPVVTLFEFQPESGTKLSRISGLSDDIAMALRAHKVRIIAPLPGKGCVGIEVPNDVRETVYLKEVLADDVFTRAKSKLTLALGKNIEGFPVVMDLAKSPHLLVAGTTGSGKSVSVNAMITSILFNASPDEVKLILIDPKQLEFAIYEDTPHLLLPVVTDPSKAATALNWAVQEMERRYKLMAEMKVRNLAGYNEKLEGLREAFEASPPSEDDVPSPTQAMLTRLDADGRASHRRMFHLVVIVDEFADLMMVAGKEVEVAVARLAQKARAAGIHVILATQRPSVDVLTGLIKANFPTRISFRLMSGTDSRTVLDTIGAENLLGMGDMLYRPPGSSELERIHGAYVDEAEIEQVVSFLSEQRAPEYDESILVSQDAADGGDSDEPVDELYDQAVAAVVEAGFASISMVQRKLRIGYNRSARIVEEMERQGVVGPTSGGSARREVLVGGLHANG